MNEADVLRPLQAAVTAAVAASSVPKIAVKYLGRVFVPPSDQKWLEIVHIPNNLENVDWGNGFYYRGLFRLILHWPVNDRGVYEPMDALASIGAYFSKDRTLWYGSNAVKITDNPVSSGVIEAGSELLIGLSVRYGLSKQ